MTKLSQTMQADPAPPGDALVLPSRFSLATPSIFVGLLLLGPLPLLLKLGISLWQREQYQFFPLMLIGAAVVGWDRWQDVWWARTCRGSWTFSAVLLGLALAVQIGGVLLWVRSAAGVATLLILAGVTWRIGGWRLFRTMLPVGALLAIIIPPPGREDQNITLRLQRLAVQASSRLLDGMEVPHVRAGNVLEIPGRRLLVEQACSGINSLMSVLAFVLLWGVWKHRPMWRIVTLLPAAALFVVVGNVARITLEAWLKVRYHVDLLEGTPHELLGLVLFVACVGLALSFDAILEVVTFATGRQESEQKISPPRAFARRPAMRLANVAGDQSAGMSWVGWREWTIGAVFLAVGVWSQMRVGHAWQPAALPDNAQFELPTEFAGWQKLTREASIVERPQNEAKESFLWQYRRGDLIASIALDYPFSGYHELTTCYGMSGWKMGKREVDRQAKSGQTEVEMSKPAGLRGWLWFSAIDERGEWVPPLPPVTGTGLALELGIAGQYGQAEPTYQVQTLIQSYLPLSVAEQNDTRDLFMKARESLTSQLLAQLPRTAH